MNMPLIFDFLLYYFLLSIGVFFVFNVLNLLLTIKKIGKRQTAIIILAMSSITVIWYLVLGFESDLIYLIFMLFMLFCLFEDKIKHKLFALLIITLVSIVYETVLDILLALNYNMEFGPLVGVRYKISQIFITIFQFSSVIIYRLFSRIGVVPTKIYLSKIKNGRLFFYMLLIVVGDVFVLSISRYLSIIGSIHLSISTGFLYFTLFMGLLLTVGLLVSIQQNLKESILNARYNQLENHIDSQLKHYHQLEIGLVETRKIKHDMLNHMVCLQYLMESENHTHAKEYLEQIMQRIKNIPNTLETGNNIVDAIINEKTHLVQADDIVISFDGKLTNNPFIDLIDICTIVSNSLDNAIDAVKLLSPEEERKIQITSYFKKGYWIYKVINNAQPVFIAHDNSIKTSKSDYSRHGFGLVNIRETVEKYSGELNLLYQENKFNLEIIIKHH